MYIANTKTWYLERFIRLFAGIFVFGSVLLGQLVHPGWFYFTGFVGIMMTILSVPLNNETEYISLQRQTS